MDNLILSNNNISFEDSLNLFREFSVKSKDYTFLPPKDAKDRDFGSDFPGSLIYKPRYNDCRFYNSSFKASNGAFSIFNAVQFYDCLFEDANFNYCNFEDCLFRNKKDFSILSTGFNFSSFINCEFDNVNIKGVSFRDINMDGCALDSCIINNSSFERAIIQNSTLKNMDLRNIGIRYCKFSNVIFENIVFPILDLTNNIGLFPIIENLSTKVVFSLGYKKEVDFSEAKVLLLKLIPYYKETKQYFSILNILLLNNETDKLNQLLPIAMEYSVKQFDFDTLQNICQFIVSANLFNTKQLKKFYELIQHLIDIRKLPFNLQKGYVVYMDNIRNLLIENPKEYPCARISLYTRIDYSTLENLPIFIRDIEDTIHEINKNISPNIQLTHHSPYEFLIVLYGMLPDLLRICQTFYYAFGGVKTLSEIKNSKHEKNDNIEISEYETDEILKENINSIDFSFGPIQFKKETRSIVKKIEYTIN